MAGRRVHFVMSEDLLERIDAALFDGVSRGEFVRRAVEQRLRRMPDLDSIPDLSEPTADARFRGQPGPDVSNLRSSSRAKRDVRPIPKGGK